MIVSLPPPPAGPPFWTQLLGTLSRIFASVVSQDQAAPRIILQSPNGTTYAVTVSDAGALVVTAISGKAHV